MPSIYAHYRFGTAMLEQLPEQEKQTVLRFRRLYDMGLHGPDMFFFYNPLIHTRFYHMGKQIHQESGQVFFSRACREWKRSPSEAGRAYLLGMLTHYCLDSLCHPYVNRMEEEKLYHLEIESEFDRLLLEMDGVPRPHEKDCTGHIRLTREDHGEIARFFPGVSPGKMGTSVRNMVFFTKLLTRPVGLPRTVLRTGMNLISREQAAMLMPAEPNLRCRHTNEALLALYAQAEARLPKLVLQLLAHMESDTPLGEEFTPVFG